MSYLTTLLLFITLCLASCKETPILENFNSPAWKSDHLGCKGQRHKEMPSLTIQKEKLKRLGQNQIMALLGRPDLQELAPRNQRTYVYYYKQGHQCEGGKINIKQDVILRIRFDALDRVNEITL